MMQLTAALTALERSKNMTLVIPEGFFLCKLRWALQTDSEEMCSTIAVRDQLNAERETAQVAHAVADAWAGAWPAANLVQGYSFLGCDALKGSTSGDHEVASWDEVIPGTAPQPCPPSNCAVLVKKKTGFGGRKNTGRMFLPAGYLTEIAVGAIGDLAAGALTAFTANLAQFMDNLRDNAPLAGDEETNFMPTLLHSDPAETPTDITSLVPDRLIATQRQRMRR